MAGARVFWLCYVLGEAGIEATPWADPAQTGWEEHLDRPRGAEELVHALTSTWAIVDRCLDGWTPDTLEQTVAVESSGGMRLHTRRSILLRLLSHDAYHAGELSQTLGVAGLPQIDLWPPEVHALR
jgi:uncharacterized damage-inducible protein DinB